MYFFYSQNLSIILSTMDKEMNSCSDLTFEKLFQLAEEKFNEMFYDEAEFFYEEAYKKNPQHQILVLCYSHVLKLNEKTHEAAQILEKSLKENPNGTYKRYFELAEIYEREDSIYIFQMGIAQAEKCLSNPFLSTCPEKQIKRDIAQALASIAEIYLTEMTDVLFQNIEQKCIDALQKGKNMDPTCMDVRLQMANFLFEKDQEEEAKQELLLFKLNILEQREEYSDQITIQCAKQFMEIKQPQHSLQILQKINESLNDEPQVLYLMAECHFLMKDFQTSRELLQHCPKDVSYLQEEVAKGIKSLTKRLKQNNEETEEGMEEQDEWEDMDEQGDDEDFEQF